MEVEIFEGLNRVVITRDADRIQARPAIFFPRDRNLHIQMPGAVIFKVEAVFLIIAGVFGDEEFFASEQDFYLAEVPARQMERKLISPGGELLHALVDSCVGAGLFLKDIVAHGTIDSPAFRSPAVPAFEFPLQGRKRPIVGFKASLGVEFFQGDEGVIDNPFQILNLRFQSDEIFQFRNQSLLEFGQCIVGFPGRDDSFFILQGECFQIEGSDERVDCRRRLMVLLGRFRFGDVC